MSYVIQSTTSSMIMIIPISYYASTLNWLWTTKRIEGEKNWAREVIT